MAANRMNELLQGKHPNQMVKTELTVNTGSTVSSLGTVTIPAPGTVDYTDIRFKLATLGAETVLLTGSIDGTNYEGNLRPYVASSGLVFTADQLTANTYTIPASWPYQKYKFTKSSATATAVLGFSATFVPKN